MSRRKGCPCPKKTLESLAIVVKTTESLHGSGSCDAKSDGSETVTSFSSGEDNVSETGETTGHDCCTQVKEEMDEVKKMKSISWTLKTKTKAGLEATAMSNRSSNAVEAADCNADIAKSSCCLMTASNGSDSCVTMKQTSGCESVDGFAVNKEPNASSYDLLKKSQTDCLSKALKVAGDFEAELEKSRSVLNSSGWKRKTKETLCLDIKGMTCSGCCTRIEKFMRMQRGILDAKVDLLTSHGVFQFDPELVTAEHIEQTVVTLGFESRVASGDELVGVVVLHLAMSESYQRAEQLAHSILGVVTAKTVDEPAFSTSTSSKALLVKYNPDVTSARKIVHQLSRELGVSVQVSSPRAPSVCAGKKEMRRITQMLFWSCLLSLPVMLVEFVLPTLFSFSDTSPIDAGVWGTANRLSIKNAVELACATPVVFIVAWPIHQGAFFALRYGRRITIDALTSLSTCAAYTFSVFTVVTVALAKCPTPIVEPDQENSLRESPQEQMTPVKADTFFADTVLLVAFILVGRYVKALVKARASSNVDALLRMQAKTAILLEDEDRKELYIDVGLVERGDLLRVLPGTRVPTDGVVVEGVSSVDESMMTGEVCKVPKEPGAIVIGGSINSLGVLIMRVTHTVDESMITRIVRLVQEAQSGRSVRQSIADTVAAYFTTLIVILAGFMLILWYSLAKHGRVETQAWAPFPFALRFAITVLIISGPCAISLAVPTAVMVATTRGSQVGILFKDGRALEALGEVDVVVFDKTGTLTTAQFEVASVIALQNDVDQTKLWRCVAAAEKDSEHIIGKTLVAYAETQLQGTQIDQAQGFEVIPGGGVHCTVDGVYVRLGSLAWLSQQTYGGSSALRVPEEFVNVNQRFQSQGCIVVFVALDGEMLSAIALRDPLRPEAKGVICQLKREGVQSWIVTGDQRGTAIKVAMALGVHEDLVLAESLPHQKVDKVRLLQSRGLRVAFVGNGMNDAPALATADVGVALGGGTNVALDAADVVLIRNDLRDLLNARALSNASNRRIKHNFVWGFMYNLLTMPIACGALYIPFGVWIPPALAGLSELLSSVPVVLFSLLLKLWKPPYNGAWGHQHNYMAIDVSESTPLLQKRC